MIKKLTLFQQLAIFIAIVAAVAMAIASIGIAVYMKGQMDDNQAQMEGELKSACAAYLDSAGDRLTSLGKSHSMWTELLDATSNSDIGWIKENASEYLVSDSAYMVDLVYIHNTKSGHATWSGHIDEGMRSLIDGVDYDVNKEESFVKLVSYNGNAYVMSINTLSDTGGNRPSGIYVLGYRVDNRIEKAISKQFSLESDIRVGLFEGLSGNGVFGIDDVMSTGGLMTLGVGNIKDNDMIMDFISFILLIVVLATIPSVLIIREVIIRMSSNVEGIVAKIDAVSHSKYGELLNISVSKEFDDINAAINRLTSALYNKDELISKNYFEMISMLIKALEEVDVYTKGHSERVSHYACALAEAMEYPDIDSIRMSGLLHDVGKITVDSAVLNKPDKLTDEEFEAIKRHPVIGHEILDTSNVFISTKEFVLHHHERYDGKGYPHGLSGAEIPLGARIISVADVFDALTTDRSYRGAMSVEMALDIITDQSGAQFDPELVAVLVQIAHTIYDESSSLNRSPSYEEILGGKVG